jgi:hypothetical protein
VGVKIIKVSDGFKYNAVKPSFPWGLRSSRYGRVKTNALPTPLMDSDVFVSVGDTEIGVDIREDSSTLLKKIMFEKFKMSRKHPGNPGIVKCRFGRILTYQDALEQFEILVPLPILLIGVSPQDLLEITDISSLKNMISPASTPDRRLKGGSSMKDKSPYRLTPSSSTPDRSGQADRLGPNDTTSRATQSRGGDTAPETAPAPVPRAKVDPRKAGAAEQPSNVPPVVEMAKKKKTAVPVKPADRPAAAQSTATPDVVKPTANPAANAYPDADESKNSSKLLGKIIIGVVAMLILLFMFGFFSSPTTIDIEYIPAFTEKPISMYVTDRVFADPGRHYTGVLTPDITISNI